MQQTNDEANFPVGLKNYITKVVNELQSKFNTNSSGLAKTVNTKIAPLVDMLDTEKYRIGLSDIESTVGDIIKGITSFDIPGLIGDLVGGAGKVLQTIAQMDAEMRTNLEGQGSAYGELADGMRKQIGFIGSEVANYGVTMKQTMDGVRSLTDASGKLALVGKETIAEGLEASAAYTKSNTFLLENVEKFRNVGLGLADAAKTINEIGKLSIGLGLNAKKVTDGLVDKLDKLNSFGFKNGIEGLGRMVQQAQSLNISVDNTLKIAYDLFDPAKAIDLTANLQALGGAFGDFNDPLKLMYDAINNVDGLQDSLIGAARSLATYNTEQQRFEVSGANLIRANEIAGNLHMQTADLASMAVKAANKFEIMSKIDMFPNIKPEQKEFVANLATLKGGKVGFDIPDSIAKKIFGEGAQGGFKSIEEMGGYIGEFKELQQKMADEKPIDIARSQYNATSNIMHTVNSIALRLGAKAYNSESSDALQKAMSALSTALYNANTNPENKGKSIGQVMQSESFKKDINSSLEDFRNAGGTMLTEIGQELGITGNKMDELKKYIAALFGKAKSVVSPAITKAETGISAIGSKISEKVGNFEQNVKGNLTVTHNFTGLSFPPGSVGDLVIKDPNLKAHIDTTIQQTLQAKQSGRDYTMQK
jgi:hypothetical protein